MGLATECHRDRLARVGLAPDFVLDALLEHHVVAEHVVERHVGPGWGRDGGEKAGDEADGMHRGDREGDAHRRLLRVAIRRDERKGKSGREEGGSISRPERLVKFASERVLELAVKMWPGGGCLRPAFAERRMLALVDRHTEGAVHDHP